MIELEHIAYRWDDRPLLEDVSLRVAAGEVCGVLGPNGAGKSTLLRVALGLLPPTRGVVRIDGADLASLSRREVARHVAAVVQEEPAGFPLSVKEYVLLGRVAHLPAHGFEAPADVAIAQAVMSEVGVLGFAERMLRTLSGGERGRVLLARALAQGSPALVLDEPAANLDLRHQLELFTLLRRRAAAGSSILVTVHDLNLAARFCDRVVVLDGQGTIAAGRPDEVLTVERLASVFGVEIHTARTSDGTPYFIALRPTSPAA